MIAWIGKIFKTIIVSFLTLFKRALCFLNRKRRNSGSILPTHIDRDSSIPTQVLPMNGELSSASAPSQVATVEQSQQELYAPEAGDFAEWDNWGNGATQVHNNPVSAQRGHAASVPVRSGTEEAEPAPEPDYFSDLGLAPTIKKQKKVFVKPSQQESSYHNNDRLSFKPDDAIPMSAELGEWEDVGCGWDADDVNLDSDDIRQTRRAELEKRRAEHQRRNQEKEARKLAKETLSLGARATRLSS